MSPQTRAKTRSWRGDEEDEEEDAVRATL